MQFGVLWVFILCFSCPSTLGKDEYVTMKIVDEVSNYGWNSNTESDSSSSLKPKVPPANFSGPEHLKWLHNKCYSLLLPDYKYKLCLFNNVTQHERTMRWNPYSGILGVWTEWNIANYSFVSMMMKNGDDCGKQNRQVEVVLVCGRTNNLTSVSEPSQCKYKMLFETPLVCHEHAMLVYPTLNKTFRDEWDEIEQDFHEGISTEKGYKYYLTDMFSRAGLMLPPKRGKKFNGFDSLETCNTKYMELLEENIKLKNLMK